MLNLRRLHTPAQSVVLALCFAAVFTSASSHTAEKSLTYNTAGDEVAIYVTGLITRALQRSDKHRWTYQKLEGEMSQARSITMVRDGKLDVMWAATNQEMEDTLLPVRIPLYKGLLGHRVFIINPDNRDLFNSIKTRNDLQRISVGQGRTWADTSILRHNGIEVITANKYEGLFYMVDGGRFDAFPRGVQEPWTEISSRPELALSVEPNIMLVYKMPFYLFVGPDNFALANELENGLRKMIADGSFHEYFISNRTVQDVVNKSNIKNRISFYLDNPTLPPKTPISDSSLWLDPTQL